MAAALASRTMEEILLHSQVAESDREMLKDDHWRAGVRATSLQWYPPRSENVKFCLKYGVAIRDDKYCNDCGIRINPDAEF